MGISGKGKKNYNIYKRVRCCGTGNVLSESFLHLLLWPIFCQLHPNFINVHTVYASEIWAQLTKNLLTKSSTKRFREYMEKKWRKRYEKDNFGYAACSLHDGDRNADDGICEEVVRDL